MGGALCVSTNDIAPHSALHASVLHRFFPALGRAQEAEKVGTPAAEDGGESKRTYRVRNVRRRRRPGALWEGLT